MALLVSYASSLLPGGTPPGSSVENSDASHPALFPDESHNSSTNIEISANA